MWPGTAPLGLSCTGGEVFDDVVVWFEFGPLWLLLIGESRVRRWSDTVTLFR